MKNLIEVARMDSFVKESEVLKSLSLKVKRDIREISDEKNENAEILDSLIEGVITLNSNNLITYLNFMAEKMLQDNKSNLINKSLYHLKMPPYFIEHCQNLAKNAQEKNKVVKAAIILEEKTKIFLDVIAIPKKQNQGALLILQDRTSDNKMLQMGKDFIANASHELKTPLTIIRGYAETLEDVELPPEMVFEIITKIRKTSQRLEKIIFDLLKLAEVENLQNSHFLKCDLKQIVMNCKDMILLAKKDVKIEVLCLGEDFFIFAEEGLLELAIKNLLENGVKYSKEVFITITLKKENDKIILAIQDKGIGIAENDLPFIFERFFTVNKTKKTGTGLGLSIVKNIVEKHEGQIKVTSELGKGTTFELFLPTIKD
jgi:two-component system, OmpR family, phosphate regulon sensor histidine kinase PhoR